jgi:hypothetical protein
MQATPPNSNQPNTSGVQTSLDKLGDMLSGLKNSVNNIYTNLELGTRLLSVRIGQT